MESSGAPLKITAEPQKEPDKCKFILEKPLSEWGSFLFSSAEEAEGSALPTAIFELKNVAAVFVAANYILVTKSDDNDWRETAKNVGQAIRKAMAGGKPLLNEALKEKLPKEGEIKKEVQKILEEEINPAVATHGGYIELLDVKNNDIFIRMGGGCQGCAMSVATLKMGVEQALRKAIPALGAIYDTTDHAGGQNPYYQPGT